MIDIDRVLEDMTGRYSTAYQGSIEDLFVSYIENDRTMAAGAREQLAERIAETMGICELIGAEQTLQTAADVLTKDQQLFSRDRENLVLFAQPKQNLVPRVTLKEAVQNMVSRTPKTLRVAAERTAQAIAKLYSKGNVVAFVRAAETQVTKAAQAFIAEAIRKGMSEGQAGRRLAMTANEIRKRGKEWSEGYARMVFRTNANTAVTAGKFRQAQDQTVKDLMPAFQLSAVHDSDVRPNHAQADGIILRVDNQAWGRLAPPLGYNCRCSIRHLSIFELRAMGRIDRRGNVKESRIPAGAGPDPGFRHGGRPDLFMNAGGK